jgi:translation initiation factor IF-3
VAPPAVQVKGQDIFQELRCNERIRLTPIRLIDHEGNQVGVVETRDALARAREVGLDLVEVAPQSRPPVCRIMDYGKWKYAQSKKERKSHSSKSAELKEMRIRTPKISQHDLEIKVTHARGFLLRGDRVQFTLWMRGRELAHQDLGREILNSIKAKLVGVAKVERDMGMEGRSLSMLLTPLAAAKAGGKPKPAVAKPPKPAAAKAVAPEKAIGDGQAPASAPAPPSPAPPPEPAQPASPAPAAAPSANQ